MNTFLDILKMFSKVLGNNGVKNYSSNSNTNVQNTIAIAKIATRFIEVDATPENNFCLQ